MKKLTLLALSTAALFTLQGRAEASQCVNCPADPNTLFTNITCTLGSETYTCYDQSSSTSWSGFASEITSSMLNCDNSGNCTVAGIGTVPTKAVSDTNIISCAYDLIDPQGVKASTFTAGYMPSATNGCDYSSTSCCNGSDFCCPDPSDQGPKIKQQDR